MSRLTSKRHPDLLVSPPIVPADTQCCSFNQDYSCIAVGHKKGYTILNCDPFGKVHSKSKPTLRATLTLDDQGATGVVEMLFCTSLVALVGAADTQPNNSPRKLQIVNTKVSPSSWPLLTPAAIHHMRAHLPHLGALGQDEPEAPGGRAGE